LSQEACHAVPLFDYGHEIYECGDPQMEPPTRVD
jgi:hypothetical protein